MLYELQNASLNRVAEVVKAIPAALPFRFSGLRFLSHYIFYQRAPEHPNNSLAADGVDFMPVAVLVEISLLKFSP